MWIEENERYYADSLELPEGYRLGWSYIPHFIHVRFYTYAYAFAHLVAFSLAARYREDPEQFAPAYLDFLASGSSQVAAGAARAARRRPARPADVGARLRRVRSLRHGRRRGRRRARRRLAQNFVGREDAGPGEGRESHRARIMWTGWPLDVPREKVTYLLLAADMGCRRRAVALIGAVTALGFALGRYLRKHQEVLREPFGVLQGALLGVVGLILAFGLTLAVGRYQDRRAATVAEANAIGTSYLRAQLIAEPARSRSLALFPVYTDLAIQISKEVPGSAGMRRTTAAEGVLQRRLWRLAGRSIDSAPSWRARRACTWTASTRPSTTRRQDCPL